jgi:vitamin K-dependent gamma-carboxylase
VTTENPEKAPAPATEPPAGKGSPGAFGWLRSKLFAPVDGASLAFFRVAFGLIMVWEMWRYYSNDWIYAFWIEPTFHFTYYGFGWVQPWPGVGMYVHCAVVAALALFVALGLFYRVSIALFFVGFTYLFLLDQTAYQNHLYLICLLSFLMIFVPANRVFSLDALRRPEGETVPAWGLWILRFQMGVVYFYGGLAKLNGDWLRGEPMTIWLAPYANAFSINERLLGYFFSYGGLLFDLLIVPFLLWKRTRQGAFVLAVGFHLTNSGLFSIGIFPWFAIAATTLFLDPSWPRDLIRAFQREDSEREPETGTTGVPVGASARLPGVNRNVVLGLLAVFVAVQLLVPLRHHLYPGDINWSNEGSKFAWHMMIRDVYAERVVFVAEFANGQSLEIDPSYILSGTQDARLAFYPNMVLVTAHRISDDLRERGFGDAEVRAEVDVSLNGREPQPLVRPEMDLSSQPVSLAPASWIMPLEQPLRARTEGPVRGEPVPP